jgi:hypothetical protein
MADVKISGLPASTVPLAGTEVLPIVQSGTTKQVSIANVTAGRSVAALSVITPTIQAEAGSAGGTIKNGSGVAQMQWGSGGGSNLSLEVATNINPANAVVNISPTGTGSVAISPGGTATISPTGTLTISPTGALTVNPTAASTMNNVAVGGTTALTGRFTGVTSTDLTASTAVGADANKKLVSLVQPAFRATMGTAQTVSGITATKLQYDTETFDTNSNYDPTTNFRFTPTVAGYYQINANYTGAQPGPGGDYNVSILRNGVSIGSNGFNSGAGSFTNSPSFSTIAFFNGTTDYVEAFVYVAVGQTIASGTDRSFTGSFLRGA